MAKLQSKEALAAGVVGLLGGAALAYQHKEEFLNHTVKDGKPTWKANVGLLGQVGIGIAAVGAYMYMKNPSKYGLEGAAYAGVGVALSAIGTKAGDMFWNVKAGSAVQGDMNRKAITGAYMPAAEELVPGAFGLGVNPGADAFAIPQARGRVVQQGGRSVLRIDM